MKVVARKVERSKNKEEEKYFSTGKKGRMERLKFNFLLSRSLGDDTLWKRHKRCENGIKNKQGRWRIINISSYSAALLLFLSWWLIKL